MQVESSKGMRRGGRTLVAVAAVVLVAGCKLGGTDLGPAPQVRQVTFPTHSLALTSCQAVNIQPTVVADTGALTALAWTSQDSTIALPDSIGHLHALKPGSTVVRAASFLQPTVFDTLRVNVADPAGPFVTLAAIQQALNGEAADLSALHDSVDVVLHISPLGCRLNSQPKFTSADLAFAGATNFTQTFVYPAGLVGSVILRVNTAAVDSTTKQPVLPNGSYALTAHVKSDSGTVYATSATQVTVSNP